MHSLIFVVNYSLVFKELYIYSLLLIIKNRYIFVVLITTLVF